jgi:hypothetical protein
MMRIAPPFAGLCSFAALLPLIAGGCQAGVSTRDAANARLFLDQLRMLEGGTFIGEVDETRTPEDPFAGQLLIMHVAQVRRDGARIPFHVGEDRSRTWVITMEDNRLHLRHDHRDPDGTPHDLTDYGGFAAGGGTAHRQSFPADEFTASLIPEAATNVWTLEIDREREVFIYDLRRHGRPRFRAVFDLASPQHVE